MFKWTEPGILQPTQKEQDSNVKIFFWMVGSRSYEYQMADLLPGERLRHLLAAPGIDGEEASHEKHESKIE